MYKTITLFASLLLVTGCGSVQKPEESVDSDQTDEIVVSVELIPQTEIDFTSQDKDSCWYFLSEKEGRYFIDESEDIPLMKIYIENGKGLLNVCYGQEGFLFYMLQIRISQNITDYYCLDDPDGADTLVVKSETLSSGIVVWTIPNPFTQEVDYETIFTIPESRMSAFQTKKDSTSIGNSLSEEIS